jgi:hypothetical protein
VRRGDADEPSDKFVVNLDNFLHVGHLDRLLGRRENGEGGCGRSIFDEAATGSEKTANEKKFEELLGIPGSPFISGRQQQRIKGMSHFLKSRVLPSESGKRCGQLRCIVRREGKRLTKFGSVTVKVTRRYRLEMLDQSITEDSWLMLGLRL